MSRDEIKELWYTIRDEESDVDRWRYNIAADASMPDTKSALLAKYRLIDLEIVTMEAPQRIPGINLECWEWRHGGPWSELAPTKQQALIDQREYAIEILGD